MIHQVRLQNFKGHVDTEVPLGRLTMLVGDNASGKTSVLDALWLQTKLNPAPSLMLKGDYDPRDLVRRGSNQAAVISSSGSNGLRWTTKLSIHPQDEDSATFDGTIDGQTFSDNGKHQEDHGEHWEWIPETLGTAELYRLQAGKIAAPAYSRNPNPAVQIDGGNTAVVLAALKLGDDERFDRIESAARKLVPSIKRIRIRPALVHRSTSKEDVLGQRIHFDFDGAANIPAHGASQGTLVALSLLTILHAPRRPNLILFDDFDHALHPRAQMELVRIMQDLLVLPEFAEVQIVAATHSPYVLDCLDPINVQVFATREDGTVASKRLSEHPQADQTKGAISAGQLWSLDPERDWVIGK